jgi:hypothetical protein
MVPANRWINALNLNALNHLINRVITVGALPHYKTYLQCAFLPLLKQAWSFACDCGTSKAPAGTNCYPQLPPQPVATCQAFSGLNMTVEENDCAIIVDPTTVSETQDCVDIVVSTAADSSDDGISTPELVILSDGFSVTTTDGTPLAGPVTLCIHRDQSVALPLGGQVHFCTKDSNDKFVKANTVLITNNDFSTQVCGRVSDTQTYYAASFQGTPLSSASSNLLGMAILLAVVFLLF